MTRLTLGVGVLLFYWFFLTKSHVIFTSTVSLNKGTVTQEVTVFQEICVRNIYTATDLISIYTHDLLSCVVGCQSVLLCSTPLVLLSPSVVALVTAPGAARWRCSVVVQARVVGCRQARQVVGRHGQVVGRHGQSGTFSAAVAASRS